MSVATTNPTASLWFHRDFRWLWLGQAISQIGSQVSFLALPLVAAITLDATPLEMGILTAMGAVPDLIVGLFAGAIVDRRRRRPLMIAGDIGRAGLLALVPLAWAFDALSMELLFGVALAIGVLTLVFDLAYGALLPTIVPREKLVDANAKLELSRTAAEVAGPGAAGALIALLTAPVALVCDAASYLVSGLCIARIRAEEPEPAKREVGSRIWAEIRQGVTLVARDPRLRALAGGRGLIAFFNAMLEAVFVLYVVRTLGLGPAMIGVIFSIGGLGFLLGAFLPERLSGRIGLGPATAVAVVLVGLSDLLVPLAGGSLWVVVPLLVIAEFSFGLGLTVYNVNVASLRQAIVPGVMLGRAGATLRLIAAGLGPAGAIAGGVLGGWIGLRETLVLAAAGELLVGLWILWSPLGRLRVLPEASS